MVDQYTIKVNKKSQLHQKEKFPGVLLISQKVAKTKRV